jgi:glycosyltransferase involved in cell wall biosynthesis
MDGTRRTRVLLYVPLLEIGGTESRVGRLAAGLDPARFECIAAWSDAWGPVGDRLVDAGIQVTELPLNASSPNPTAVHRLREIAPDIFHSFSYKQHAGDVLAAREADVPLIVTSRVNARNWDAHDRVQDWELTRNVCTDWITAVSAAAAAPCVNIEGFPSERITVIRNGVRGPEQHGGVTALRRELGLSDSVALVGYLANYRREKGHALLLEAFRHVLDVRPDTHLVCCGADGDGGKASLRAMLATSALEGHVSLLDSRTDVDAVYRALNLYVNTSVSEGLSNAILEAMAYGLPVVATRVGGTPEAVLDGATGLLAPPDARALATAMVRLLNDPQRRRTMGQAGYDRFRRDFTIDSMVNGYASLYDDLHQSLASRGGRSSGAIA